MKYVYQATAAAGPAAALSLVTHLPEPAASPLGSEVCYHAVLAEASASYRRYTHLTLTNLVPLLLQEEKKNQVG